MKLLLYCAKANHYLLHMPKDNEEVEKGIEFSLTDGKEFEHAGLDVNNYKLNGKIVAECNFEVEEIYIGKSYGFLRDIEIVYTDSLRQPIYLSQKSCLKLEDICEYLNHKDGYAIHIKNLHIFDNPKELNEYFTKEKKINTLDGYNWVCESINRAPQNMSYAYDNGGNKYILISIKSQGLCKILNGDKTIEIRKKLLKGMLQ